MDNIPTAPTPTLISPPAPTNKTPLIILSVLVLLLLAATGLLAYQNYQLNQKLSASTEQTTTLLTPSPLTYTPSPSPIAAQNTKTCSNNYLRVALDIPAAWNCKSTEDEGAGWINLTSSLFIIELSNLGRGPWCSNIMMGSDPPQPDPSCVISNYYTNSNTGLNLQLYKYNGENKEIFGTYKNTIPDFDGVPWVSVKWQGMESHDLTAAEKEELVTVLNSIRI